MSVYSGELDITTIKKGDIFYECEYGQCLRLVALSKPKRDNSGRWTWKAKDDNGIKVDYLVTEGYAHYGPKLYSYQPYI